MPSSADVQSECAKTFDSNHWRLSTVCSWGQFTPGQKVGSSNLPGLTLQPWTPFFPMLQLSITACFSCRTNLSRNNRLEREPCERAAITGSNAPAPRGNSTNVRMGRALPGGRPFGGPSGLRARAEAISGGGGLDQSFLLI